MGPPHHPPHPSLCSSRGWEKTAAASRPLQTCFRAKRRHHLCLSGERRSPAIFHFYPVRLTPSPLPRCCRAEPPPSTTIGAAAGAGTPPLPPRNHLASLASYGESPPASSCPTPSTSVLVPSDKSWSLAGRYSVVGGCTTALPRACAPRSDRARTTQRGWVGRAELAAGPRQAKAFGQIRPAVVPRLFLF
jgi:hypothetical protein